MKRRKIVFRVSAAVFAVAVTLAFAAAGNRIFGQSVIGKVPPVAPEQALKLLAAHSGKTIVWVGDLPAKNVAVSRSWSALSETVGEWADEWEAAVIITPNAVFFHAPKTFDHIRPAHFDALLPRIPVTETLTRLPLAALAHFPLGVADQPREFVPTSLAEAAPLSIFSAENPEFEKELRELLKQAQARARGERQTGGEKVAYDIRLAEAPTEQLYVRLFSETQAYCAAGAGRALLTFPVSPARYAVNSPLFIPAQPLVEDTGQNAPAAVETLRLTAGEMIRGGRFTGDNRQGAAVVIDKRLERIPVTLILPRGGQTSDWSMLEAGLGIERRDLGETLFFGAWMDEERHRRFSLISRWARARGELWLSLFFPYIARPRSVSVREIGWQRLAVILGELRRRQALGDKEAATLDLREFAADGRISFGQAVFLDVLYVTKPEADGASPTILGRHNFFLD